MFHPALRMSLLNKFQNSLCLLFSLLLLSGCGDLTRENQRFGDIIQGVKTRCAPDPRTSIFGVSFNRTNKGIALSGEVDNVESKQALIDALSPFVKKITDNITVLPDAKLGGQGWGIVRVSVANMRRDPDETSELVSQAIMGNLVRVLRQSGDWYLVQTPDRYLGWMHEDSFVIGTKTDADAWITAPRVIVLATNGTLRESPTFRSDAVADYVAGSLMKNLGGAGGWNKVALPDGRVGYVPSDAVADYDTWKKNTRPSPEGVERMARSLLGIPYLWGGTSTKAMDCSGFTKTVYLMNGVELSRDANQQAEQGVEISPGSKFENLQKGDLLFFGRKAGNGKPEEILHVAMYLKGRTFIHSSGMVKMNSLDPASPIFDPNKIRSFICARRVLPAAPTLLEAASRR